MNIPLFSIIVPVYNTEKYISECIESILKQNFTDYELILVDDGSKDNSGEVCDKYAAVDQRVKVIHKENGGATSARKKGAESANGRYVITVDSDDSLTEGALDCLADIIIQYNPDAISFGFYRIWSDRQDTWLPTFRDGIYIDKKLDELKRIALYRKDMPFFTYGLSTGTCTQCVKSSFFKDKQRWVDEQIILGEDLCVTVPVVMESKSIYVLKQPLFLYRQLENSVSHTFRKNDIEDLKNLLKYLAPLAKKNEHDFQQQLAAYCLHRLHSSLSVFAKNALDYKTYKEMLLDISDELFDVLAHLRNEALSIKMFLILYAIKFKLWWLFWFFYRNK